LMRDAGYISEADMSRARAYPLQLANKTVTGETAPYFVEWIRQQLDAQFGKQLYEQGLKVYTTLDLDMQGAAERALERQAKAIEGGRFGPYQHETYEHYMAHREGDEGSGTSPYLQSAFLAMDPRTGAVRAMIGGRDFDDSKFNRSVQALRQPGSTFKPIVYSAAVQNGRPPSYIVNDSPLVLQVPGQPEWAPQNYDLRFLGEIPLRESLYLSRNVSTVRLGMELGEQTVINEARNFGITTPIPPYPSIHIGAADVYPIELISGYWYGLDRPQKITDNAQGGVLAAPAWTAFMTEVYRRKPAPPDWPRPSSIVTREIDISSGLLATQYCPRDLVTTEFYISGTE